jgi:hypothetical protein
MSRNSGAHRCFVPSYRSIRRIKSILLLTEGDIGVWCSTGMTPSTTSLDRHDGWGVADYVVTISWVSANQDVLCVDQETLCMDT